MKEPPVYTTDNFAYIKCAEIGDEKVRGDFEKWIIGKTIPLLNGERDLAYAHDWARFWRCYSEAPIEPDFGSAKGNNLI